MRPTRLTMQRFSDAAQRIGGPYSVTWFAFWVTLVLNLLHHFIGSPDLQGRVVVRLAAVLLAQVAVFAVLLLARVTVLRNTAVTPRPVLTLLCFALAGLARAVVILAIVSAHVELTWSQVGQRLISGPIPFTAYLAVCAYLMDVYEQNKKTLAQAAATQADLVAARDEAQAALKSQGGQTIDEVRTELARRLDSSGSATMTPEQLDRFLDDTVRPMSHRLAARVRLWSPPATAVVTADLSLRRLLASLGVNRPFSPAVQSLLCLAPTFALLPVLPFRRFVMSMVVVFLAPWLMLTLGNRVLSKLTPHVPLRQRTAAVAAWTLITMGMVSVSWGLMLLGTPFVKIGAAYGAFETAWLTIATVVAKAALMAQRNLESELQSSGRQLRWEIVRIHQIQWRQQHQVARALHGPVASVVLQQSASGASEDTGQVRRRIIEALDTSLSVSAAPPSVDCLLEQARRSWSGVCDVTGEIEVGSDCIDELSRACLSDLVHEAVSNAVRHGAAHRVLVVVAREVSALRVTVLDDGRKAHERRVPGLGTQMLEACSLEWSLHRSGEMTRLRFSMPVVWQEDSVAAPITATN